MDYLKKLLKKEKSNFVDYMFVHNQNIKKNYEKIISGKVIPQVFLNNIKEKNKIN